MEEGAEWVFVQVLRNVLHSILLGEVKATLQGKEFLYEIILVRIATVYHKLHEFGHLWIVYWRKIILTKVWLNVLFVEEVRGTSQVH